jgi:hypothetical protein
MMDLHETQNQVLFYLHRLSNQFHRVPGSAIFLRYVKSSYQNDPVRSAVELFLFLFAVRYLLAPKYSTKPNFVALSEEVSEIGHPSVATDIPRLCGFSWSWEIGDYSCLLETWRWCTLTEYAVLYRKSMT